METNTKQTTVQAVPQSARPATRSAAGLAEELVPLICQCDPSTRAVLLARLAMLAATIEATPAYFPEEMSYLRNRLASIRRLIEAEEWGAAVYEMRELARKLRRWDGGDPSGLPVPVHDPDPQMPLAVAAVVPRE